MILPTKHLRPERALIGVGAEILRILRQPMTVSRLWDELRQRRAGTNTAAPIAYDWFILALDLLHIIGAIDFQDGLIRRNSP